MQEQNPLDSSIDVPKEQKSILSTSLEVGTLGLLLLVLLLRTLDILNNDLLLIFVAVIGIIIYAIGGWFLFSKGLYSSERIILSTIVGLTMSATLLNIVSFFTKNEHFNWHHPYSLYFCYGASIFFTVLILSKFLAKKPYKFHYSLGIKVFSCAIMVYILQSGSL